MTETIGFHSTLLVTKQVIQHPPPKPGKGDEGAYLTLRPHRVAVNLRGTQEPVDSIWKESF